MVRVVLRLEEPKGTKGRYEATANGRLGKYRKNFRVHLRAITYRTALYEVVRN